MQESADLSWQYDHQNERLFAVGANDYSLLLPYKSQQLVNMTITEEPFSIENASQYQELVDVLSAYPEGSIDADVEEAALCAVGFTQFGCPQMPQSWHFQKSDLEQWPIERQLCELNSGFDQGLFLIIDIDDEFASCMLLSEQMKLSAIKEVAQFHVIKVLNNRLLPATIDLAASAQGRWSQQLA